MESAITWIFAISSVFIVSIISLVGILTFALNEQKVKKALLFLVSFSAGSLFGGALLHLMPEAADKLDIATEIPLFVLLGIILFFVLEKFIHWRHCHIPTSKHHPHPVGMMNLVGDGMHNLMDGMVIAASYIASIPLGIATTFAVIVHEIPQEIGDFGVLLHAGYTRLKAVFFNFLSALIAVAGALIVLFLGSSAEHLMAYVLPVTAGGFIYIAGSDLIPELKKENTMSQSIWQLFGICLGIFMMIALKVVFK